MPRGTSPGSGSPSTAASRCDRRRSVLEVAHETPDVTEVLVALDVRGGAFALRIHAHPRRGGFGDEEVGALRHPVLQELVREDHVGARQLPAATDHLTQEAAVV